MTTRFWMKFAVIPMALAIVGCQNAPGTRSQQGAVIGGAAGAATGAAVAKNNRGLGALIGGVLGAGGGYVIAQRTDHPNADAAVAASQNSQRAPASVEQARNAATADLNGDGFVTLDEVVAMKQAGYSEQQMLQRLQATGQVFQLTADQERYLMDHGVSRYLVNQMEQMNQQSAPARNDVIGRPQ
jgi:hypothetical protein